MIRANERARIDRLEKSRPAPQGGRLSVESLPYTLLLLLGQFTAGCAIVLLAVYLRRRYELSFIRTCSWMTVSGAGALMLLTFALTPHSNVGGYHLHTNVFDAIKALSIALTLFSLAHVYFLRVEGEDFLVVATGATSAALGALILFFMADLVSPPAWNLAGPVLTMFAGALTLGTATIAMVWGHWYLVKPSLEEGPLNEICLATLAAILFELAVTCVNAIIPTGQKIVSDALLAVALPSNPGFWLRVGIGLVFPAVLAFMAYKSSTERAMMSATGLLYIAVGAILAGEALGRGLLFVTGAAV
jgi:hypothetical protein